jgi:hypothetical protein
MSAHLDECIGDYALFENSCLALWNRGPVGRASCIQYRERRQPTDGSGSKLS